MPNICYALGALVFSCIGLCVSGLMDEDCLHTWWVRTGLFFMVMAVFCVGMIAGGEAGGF